MEHTTLGRVAGSRPYRDFELEGWSGQRHWASLTFNLDVSPEQHVSFSGIITCTQLTSPVGVSNGTAVLLPTCSEPALSSLAELYTFMFPKENKTGIQTLIIAIVKHLRQLHLGDNSFHLLPSCKYIYTASFPWACFYVLILYLLYYSFYSVYAFFFYCSQWMVMFVCSASWPSCHPSGSAPPSPSATLWRTWAAPSTQDCCTLSVSSCYCRSLLSEAIRVYSSR